MPNPRRTKTYSSFINNPDFALKALKAGIRQNRGRCLPTFKRTVQRQKSIFTKAKRVLIDHTTTSDYRSLVEKNFRAMPIGYVSYVLPPGFGPIIPDVFPQSVYYGKFCALYETIFFRCGYVSSGLISKVARKNPKLAKALADAAYYWETIGKAIALEWGKAAVQMAAGGISSGISGKPAPAAYSSATIKNAMGPLLKLSRLHSGIGRWADDIKVTARTNFETHFQTFVGGHHLHFAPNKAYCNPYYNMRPPDVNSENYPFTGDCPPIMELHGFGLVHNMPPRDHLENRDVSVRDFEFALPIWAVVTQFTPLLIMNDELVFAHRRKIIRVREITEFNLANFCSVIHNYEGWGEPT